MATCTATRKRGGPCEAPALAGTSRCSMHTPERRREVQRARRAGGRARMQALDAEPLTLGRLYSVADVVRAVGQTTRAVAEGRLDARTGNTVIMGLGTLGRLVVPAQIPGLPSGVRPGSVPSGGYSLRVEVVGADGLPRTPSGEATHEDAPGTTQREGVAPGWDTPLCGGVMADDDATEFLRA